MLNACQSAHHFDPKRSANIHVASCNLPQRIGTLALLNTGITRPQDRAESHNGLLLSARLSTLDASPEVRRHFCKVPRCKQGNGTVAHARRHCVAV